MVFHTSFFFLTGFSKSSSKRFYNEINKSKASFGQ